MIISDFEWVHCRVHARRLELWFDLNVASLTVLTHSMVFWIYPNGLNENRVELEDCNMHDRGNSNITWPRNMMLCMRLLKPYKELASDWELREFQAACNLMFLQAQRLSKNLRTEPLQANAVDKNSFFERNLTILKSTSMPFHTVRFFLMASRNESESRKKNMFTDDPSMKLLSWMFNKKSDAKYKWIYPFRKDSISQYSMRL